MGIGNHSTMALGLGMVSMKKSISLVEIPGSLLVIGITNDNITLLSKIEDKEILSKFKDSDQEVFHETFSDQLQKLTQKLPKKHSESVHSLSKKERRVYQSER